MAMTNDQWTAVDRYIQDTLLGFDAALDAALNASAAAGLPPIAVSASQGKLLSIMAKAIGARRILELGTLGGYSGIWLARALPPGGVLITVELNPQHAEVARRSFERAGLAGVVDLRVGQALDVLPRLSAEGWGRSTSSSLMPIRPTIRSTWTGLSGSVVRAVSSSPITWCARVPSLTRHPRTRPSKVFGAFSRLLRAIRGWMRRQSRLSGSKATMGLR
jgi:hypothetical protein